MHIILSKKAGKHCLYTFLKHTDLSSKLYRITYSYLKNYKENQRNDKITIQDGSYSWKLREKYD